MKKFIKKLWLQKNEKKILLNDVKFELYKEFMHTKYKNVKLTSYLSGGNFARYKFSFTSVPDWDAVYKSNIAIVPRRFDYFQTKMINYANYVHTFNYPGNFTLRTRNVSSLHHLYLKKDLRVLTAVTDMEAQFQHNFINEIKKEQVLGKKKEATLRIRDFNEVSQQKFNPFSKNNRKPKSFSQLIKFIRNKQKWRKTNLLQFWNRFFGYTQKVHRELYFQIILYRIFQKKYNFFAFKTKRVKKLFSLMRKQKKREMIKTRTQISYLYKPIRHKKLNDLKFNLVRFISWIFYLHRGSNFSLDVKSLKQKKLFFFKPKFQNFLFKFASISKFFMFFKKWKTWVLSARNVKVKQVYPWSFFTLLLTGNISPRIVLLEKKFNLERNYLRVSRVLFKFRDKRKAVQFRNPFLSFCFRLLCFALRFSKITKNSLFYSYRYLWNTTGKEENKRIRFFKHLFFLVKRLNLRLNYMEDKRKDHVKSSKRMLIARFFGKNSVLPLQITSQVRRHTVLRKRRYCLMVLKRCIAARKQPFRPLLKNLHVILNQIAHLEKSAKFKRNIVHTICKYTSFLEFQQMVTLISPFKFFSKNMLYTVWLNESYFFFRKYRRKQGRPLLTSTTLIRPILRKLKNLGMSFLAFFIKNPVLQTNKILPMNLHKLFLNSIKNYFIPLKTFTGQHIPFSASVTKRVPFVLESLQPIKIVFSPYKQRKRSLQVNILNSKNQNLFSSWPGLVIRKISSIVGVHQAHKYTFLLNMKPKKAKRNFMAKSLTIRHASNYLYKYLRRSGGSFEVIVRTTTAITPRMEDSYVKLLMGFIYGGFDKRKKVIDLDLRQKKKKKHIIPFKLRSLQHSYSPKLLGHTFYKNKSLSRILQFDKKNKKILTLQKKKKLILKKIMLLRQRPTFLKKFKQLKYRNNTKVLCRKKSIVFFSNTFQKKPKKSKNLFGLSKTKVKKKIQHNKKAYHFKYLLIFFKYILLTRKFMVLLLRKLFTISTKQHFLVLSNSFLLLNNYISIFRFFIKSIFFSFFLPAFLKGKKKNIRIFFSKQKSFRPFYSLLHRLRHGYFRTIKKVYFTQYTVYTKTTHGYPTKKRKNRRL